MRRSVFHHMRYVLKKICLKGMEHAPELFLVAVDKETGTIAGFLNGLATDEEAFRDEFFTDITVHNPEGKNIMLLGLDVLPEYRGQGLAREIVYQYLQRRREKRKRRNYPYLSGRKSENV